MSLVLIGGLLLLLGVLLISFPELCSSLKKHDEPTWHQLGDPYGGMFASKTITVFSWILDRGYTHVDSDEVFNLGEQAYKQALIAKYLCLAGLSLLVVGAFLGWMFSQMPQSV